MARCKKESKWSKGPARIPRWWGRDWERNSAYFVCVCTVAAASRDLGDAFQSLALVSSCGVSLQSVTWKVIGCLCNVCVLFALTAKSCTANISVVHRVFTSGSYADKISSSILHKQPSGIVKASREEASCTAPAWFLCLVTKVIHVNFRNTGWPGLLYWMLWPKAP